MAKPAMIAYISQVNYAIVDLLPCRLFIYKCFQNFEHACFNSIQFDNFAQRIRET